MIWIKVKAPAGAMLIHSDPAVWGLAMAASVLVADDEANIVLSLKFLLSQAGFEVRVASDGEAALAAVAENPPDLVLLDVMIPKRDGYDVCQAIRANPAWSKVRIVMLTAKGRDVERVKGLALGADDYVTKPFSTRELVDKVKRILAVPGCAS
jgi:DNA-binding response OmpR family regulator